MVESLARLLREHPFASDFSDDQVAFMTGCAENLRFEPGAHVFRENESADRLYLIRSGRVAIEIHAPGKGTLQLETLTDGDVMGWSVFFEPYVWHVDARVLDRSLVLAFDGNCLRTKMAEDVAFAYVLTRRVLYEVHRRLERVRLHQADVYRGPSQ